MESGDQFILLRHARAGNKLRDRAKDFERGLDRKGQQVALRLPNSVTRYLRPELILSSPFRRCVQTVEPLAHTLGQNVAEDERFRPDCSARSVRVAFAEVPAGSVVCTHGEVIARLFDGRVKCAKGGFWVVSRRNGEFVPVLYVEAPAARPRPQNGR
jgi:8-oxo-(d)GTP phosphatase